MPNSRRRRKPGARFTAPGRASNWEMAGLREQGVWRNTRWTYPWRSLADPFHPKSLQEWTDNQKEV